MSLAIATYQKKPTKYIRALAATYNVPESTLRTRLQGVQLKHEIRSPNRKLYPIEDQSLLEWILDLDRRGFSPQIINVRRMANNLPTTHG